MGCQIFAVFADLAVGSLKIFLQKGNENMNLYKIFERLKDHA